MSQEKEMKLTPESTWFQGKLFIAVVSALVAAFFTIGTIGIKLAWNAAVLSAKMDTTIENTKDLPKMREDIAVMKVQIEQQSSYLAGLEKKISDLAGGLASVSATLPLSPNVSPPYRSAAPRKPSTPDGWTLGPDGKLKKL